MRLANPREFNERKRRNLRGLEEVFSLRLVKGFQAFGVVGECNRMKNPIQFAVNDLANVPSESLDFFLIAEVAGQYGSVLDDSLKLGFSLFVADGIDDPGAFFFE